MSHYRPRRTTTRIAAAAALAGLLALTFLAGAATLGPARSVPAPQPRPAVTVRATIPQNDTASAYNAGWQAGVAALTDGIRPAYKDVAAAASDWADGWIDGQADAIGDDNRDGMVTEGESGWNCHTMGNRQCSPHSRQAARR
ncbi:hypothetical protein GTY75_09120 [Streptomyces sp. SID8381]|uniref:hypothetical protein n=1 Tax=unclassified Streptomyces TaxID=2593676 RepID=UPI0003634AD3|nr:MULTISPECIES: hypothetical protein [unclassified Streptomyces]MYX26827.1 hypothetical protein [Streptomyces sp. SID8381]